ncbi:MAG: hypothetical protein C0602_00700, partial [Denitrovibrio sp.]
MRTLIFILSLLIASVAFAADKENIKVCYLEWGKLGGEKLPDKGLVPDVVATTLREAGYNPEVQILPWVRCLKLVEFSEIDLVAGFWMGEEQKKTYQLLAPNTVDDIAFVTLDSFQAKSGDIEDFYGKRVALIRDAGGLEKFYSNEKEFKVFKVNNDIQMLELLKAGRIDAIISDPVQILSKAEKEMPELTGKLKVWDPPIQRNIGAPAVSLKNPKKDELV